MVKTITHHVLEIRKRSTERVAIQYKRKGQWHGKNWQEFFDLIESFALGLSSLGVNREDRVALMANTRWEWAVADFAILGLGGVTVPIYQNALSEEAEYILNDCEARVLILENKSLEARWLQIRERCPHVRTVIVMEPGGNGSQALSFDEVLEKGRAARLAQPTLFTESCALNEPSRIATLIYTSGTTGLPKGVVLTHRQVMSEIKEAFPLIGVSPEDVSLSFLPYAHVLGRIECWGHLFVGFQLAYAESIERIKVNLTEVRPTIFVGVPRIFEKIYGGIQTQLEAKKFQKSLFDWALRIGRQVSRRRIQRKTLSLQLAAQYLVAKKLVFDPLKDKLGGRLRFAVSGGAPLSKEVAEFFHAADILVLEGYGMTETTAAIAVNTPFDYQFGTVGKPIGDVRIRIAADGEILVKSDKVMREYYRNSQATQDSFVDGYFATGDIGEITPEGHLRITDRKKDLIKTAGGKYVAPQKLEGLLKLSPWINHVLIHGDQKKYVVALVTLVPEMLKRFVQDNKLEGQSSEEIVRHPKLREIIRQAVAEANSRLASYETLKAFDILPHDFTVEAGELTPSLKVKRKFCDQKYKAQIEALYGLDERVPASPS